MRDPGDPLLSTPEHSLLRETAARFTRDEVRPNLERWEREGLVPRELHRRAALAGLLGAGYPEAAGGSGGDLSHSMVVTEELIQGGGSSGLCAALLTHGIAIPHILAAGDPDQIARWARPALEGRLIGALAITEPDAGSDVARIRTTARRRGNEYVVEGVKTYITSGFRADFVTVAVRTGAAGHGGISLLVVERGTPGFSAATRLDKMGWLCSDTAELRFDGARVPARNLVGVQGDGFRQIMRHFQSERIALAVQAYATAQRCLELTLAWARERQAFGGPLSRHQVVRHRLVEMARRTDVARTYTRSVAARVLRGESVPELVAMAKNTAVEACSYVTDQAVQLHGGAGYMRGTEVERHYRDARILGIGGGATEIMTEMAAGRIGIDG